MSGVRYRFWHADAGREEKMLPVPPGYSITVADLDRHIKDAQLASLGPRELAEAVLLFYDADTGEEIAGDGVQISAGERVVVRLLTMWSAGFQGSKRNAEFSRAAAEAQSRRRGDEAAKKVALAASSRTRAAAEATQQQRSCSSWGSVKKTPPAGYVCHRCGVPGHYIQACPANGDPRYNNYDVPLTLALHSEPATAGSTLSSSLASGGKEAAGNAGVFRTVVSSFSSTAAAAAAAASQFPAELLCPLCKGVMRDAVLTRCCFRSFCHDCIRVRMASTSACECGATTAASFADGLVPNRTVRETIARTLASSKSGGGSSGKSGSTVTTEEECRGGRGSFCGAVGNIGVAYDHHHHQQRQSVQGKKLKRGVAAEMRPTSPETAAGHGGFYYSPAAAAAAAAAVALQPPKKLKSRCY